MVDLGKVSVIIPTFNGDEHLIRAIESVLNQTYTNIEVIVVDDNGLGTPAQLHTEKAIEPFVSDERFKYLKHEVNRNGSAARNTGFSASRGEYICFLDDDDYFLNEKIELQVRALKKAPANVGLMYCGLRVVYPGRTVDRHPHSKGNICTELLKRKLEICSSTLMIRRTEFEKIGGFDESFKRHQDWEMLVRLSSVTQTEYIEDILVIKEMLYRNNPKKAEVIERNRVHYLTQLKPIIQALTEQEQKEIYAIHYAEIARAYLLEGNLEKWLENAKKSEAIGLSIKVGFRAVGRKLLDCFRRG